MRILLIEDDPTIAEPLRQGLTRYGYAVDWAPTGTDGLRTAPASDMVLLDLGLPDIDGLDVCRRLRAHSDVALIMISARDSETDKVVGLELGADDYVVKPFLVRELIARMRAVQRRRLGDTVVEHAPGPQPSGNPDAGRLVALPTPPPSNEAYGDRVIVDRRAHRVFLDGSELRLSPKEYALLAFLADQLDALVTRESIMASVWDAHWFGPTKTLDNHVSALRHKFGDALNIQAVRGVGFRLTIGPETSPRPCAS
ncbi:response regulator transcription factor [Streptomyces sp. NPDC054884]